MVKRNKTKICSNWLFSEKDIEKQTIPVSKIVGLDLRGESGYSWWEHFSQERGELPRLAFLVRRLVTLGLEDFKETYMKEEYAKDLSTLYFPDFDMYIGVNGSHRITMAKVTNVEYLIADVSIMEVKDIN